MFFKNILFIAAAALFAGQAMGADYIATDPTAACNCPNNCKHNVGDSCEFYTNNGASTAKGSCQIVSGSLTCST
ncbi:MAG: hypothetical protein M1818_007130 [Claussenomyces sp. TS43310]|nr:MAG: hypothetical protein M1818_007130 [Claussenomyces sp. TS43310]